MDEGSVLSWSSWGAEAESSEGRETEAQFQRKSIETPGLPRRRRSGYAGSGTRSWRTAEVQGGLDVGPWLEGPPSARPA